MDGVTGWQRGVAHEHRERIASRLQYVVDRYDPEKIIPLLLTIEASLPSLSEIDGCERQAQKIASEAHRRWMQRESEVLSHAQD